MRSFEGFRGWVTHIVHIRIMIRVMYACDNRELELCKLSSAVYIPLVVKGLSVPKVMT